ncbi:MAG TPA: carboxypeptidase regulatory-like domain-containing protein [Terriglobales bacterium]|nr:carboxypeptidase regulatory-like domain-containing protein [Terriglobales bacterium]
MSRRLRFLAFVLLSIAALGFTLSAQTSRGTLTGTVTDGTGAVVANAGVKITQVDTGITRQTTTNSAGIYRFDAVDLGTYRLSVQAKGFATAAKTGIEILASRTTNIDFALKVGSSQEVVSVEATGVQEELQTSEQVRSQNFSAQTISTLPIAGGDSLTLAQLAPGVSLASGNSINQNGTLNFSVNGQRPRGNNFLIDGVENNDISVTGPAFTITNPDAVEEFSIQTANFSAEYGRSGGAIFNQVTKSGTNSLHGSAAWVYTGSAFKALNHLDKVGGLTDPPRTVENIPDFTIGGPVIIPGLYNGHNKTFFFGAGQWDRFFGKTTRTLRVATDSGVATLTALAASCPNAALYLQALGPLRGNPSLNPARVPINVPSGACNGGTRAGQFFDTAQVVREEPLSSLDNNHQIRVDHNVSDKQIMSFRWLYDSSITSPDGLNNLPGFDFNFTGRTMTGAFTDTYVISPRMTNEFRFNYGRIGFDFERAATDPFHLNLQNFGGLGNGITGFGAPTNIPQFRFANNWQYQDTMSLVRGKHTFRFGADFLRQLARQHPPFNERGSFVYSSSTGVSAFANFLDDFGGRSGSLNRQFGTSVYHPDLFRQSYFFEDSWKTTTNLTLNLGLRYELFGAPENTFTVAAFTNYDTVNFAAPHPVEPYKKNFGPTVGFAWNPKGDNVFNRMMGGEKMVWRGGFQTSYDNAFNNLLSNIAGSSPNTLGGNILSNSVGRGAASFSSLFDGIVATPPDKTSAQSNLFLGDFPNPLTSRWSLGFERELPFHMIWDASYVGSVSHHLYRTIDMNPIINRATGDRLHTELQTSLVPSIRAGQGIRTVRAASANSNYESLQINLRSNFKTTPIGSVQLIGSYSYAHYLDDISDVFAFDSTPSSFQSVSQVLGASPHIDYGDSDFDRRHVGALGLTWSPPAPQRGLLGSLAGGWTLSGVSHWQTGFPFTIANGTDRNGDGQTGPDRPDISNAAAPFNTRAIIVPTSVCASGYANPDISNTSCVDPRTVHFIEGTGGPNANTVGRNTLRAPGLDNLDFSIAKRFRLKEKSGFELRLDMFNALNTTNLGNFVADRTVNGSAKGSFLDTTQTDSFGRSMRVRAKFEF